MTDRSEGSGAHEPERLTAEQVIGDLDLSPHTEGGYFRETYRAEQKVATPHGKRSASTSILYLLTDREPSRFHRLRSDELWFYHSGALVELFLLRPDESTQAGRAGTSKSLPEVKVIGPANPCELVPAGWWVAARAIVGQQTDWGFGRAPERRWTGDRRVAGSVDWSLASCVVTPGFEYEDFEIGRREALLHEFPLAKDIIEAFT